MGGKSAPAGTPAEAGCIRRTATQVEDPDRRDGLRPAAAGLEGSISPPRLPEPVNFIVQRAMAARDGEAVPLRQ